MPGYANWKTLYAEEYLTLFEEGYDVGEKPASDLKSEFLPFPQEIRGELDPGTISEADWEKAYWNLWKARDRGLRSGYPYVEPDEFDAIIKESGAAPALTPLDEAAYQERIKGAWFGRCAGVVLGKPLEMGYDRIKIREYLESVEAYPLNDWVPAQSEKLKKTLRQDCLPSCRDHVSFAQPDDDLHYTILALLMMEKRGDQFLTKEIGCHWLDNIPYHWFWCSSRQAYYHMVNLRSDRPADEQIAEIPWRLNPWRECIDGQLRGDFWGYIAPGNPRQAATLSYKDCSFNLTKNGIYGCLFVTGCVSAALSEKPTVETIIQGGLSVIPQRSRLAETVLQVISWYRETGDWVAIADKIYERYGHLPFAGTMNNMAMVVLGLLHGQLDYTKTITTAIMCGTDTDCNGGTSGSIVGAAIGYNRIEGRWVEPLNDRIKTVVASFGEGKISDLIARTVAQRLRSKP
jgi:hypothetical protein